jgi:hypothetical protein
MILHRRQWIQSSLASAGLLAFSLDNLWAAEDKPFPFRFIFMHRGNGLFPQNLVPAGLPDDLMAKEKNKEPFTADLDLLDLPEWMSPLESHKSALTLLQGLSGKMCTTGHHSWCSSLGVMKANERPSSIKRATVDFELARLFPSPLEHIELACFPLDGGNARGNLDGIAQGFSARGPEQPNFAFGSPKIAVQELFKSVAETPDLQTQLTLERQLLAFMADQEASLALGLQGLEEKKVRNYAEAINSLREQDRKLQTMGERIRKYAPKLEAKYLADEITTIDRQMGHTDVLLATLISGLTNVVAFTVDELGHHYTGIPGLEGEKVNMHDIGHGKAIGGIAATDIRQRTEHHHMQLIARITEKLKSIPEGSGSMFDNTMLFYFPDSGETHHSIGVEFPFIILSGQNCPLDIARRYIRLPYWGTTGHKTLGNWYTTLLNAFGHPIDHYGDLDTSLNRFQTDQRGPIEALIRS